MLSRSPTEAQTLLDRGKRLLRSSLFRGGALSLLIQAQFVAVRLLTGIILARLLGPAGFGVYSFAFAVMTLIQVMPNSGLDNVVIRYSAQYRAAQSWALVRGLWRLAFVASVAYGLLTAAVVAGAVCLAWVPTTAALSPSVLAIAAIPMCFLPLTTFLGAATRAVTPGVLGQLPRFVVKPWLFLVLLVGLAILAPKVLTAEAAMYAQGAAAFGSTLMGLYWLLQCRPEQLRQVLPAYDTRRWLRSVLPFSLMGGLMLINTQADIVMVGILGTANDTGLYRVAANGANLVTLCLTAANLYIAPRVSAMYSQGERDKLQRLLSLSVRSTFGVALVIACVFWLWGAGLLRIVFGAAYLGAFWPLAVLCLGQLVNVGAGSVALVLNMTGHEGDAARMAGVAALLNVALNATLIPMFGGVGAATATATTMLVWNGLMLLRVRRKAGVDTSILSVFEKLNLR